MSHIFISYSKQNLAFARYLRALLEGEGFAVWMDEAQLPPSARWWKSIEQNIESCAAFVVIMSPQAYESDWVEREILLAEGRKRPIFPVLLAGEPWSRLANIQYEDMRAGLRARPSARFLNALSSRVPRSGKGRVLDFAIVGGDLLAIEADVVALRHNVVRQTHSGPARAVVERLVKVGIPIEQLSPPLGEHSLTPTQGTIGARQVVFVGLPPLIQMGYTGIREYSAYVLLALERDAPDARHLIMNLNGPGAGFDEVEALAAQFGGYVDAIRAGHLPPALDRITLVERNPDRAMHVREALQAQLAGVDYAERLEDGLYRLSVVQMRQDRQNAAETRIEAAGAQSETKPFVYVIMPADESLDDFYHYGIQGAVHARGLLCVRVDDNILLEEVLEQVKKRIDSASVVVADLTHADPRVYLQLGYAWGKGRPTILLAQAGAPPALELSKPAPILYKKIKDVETALAQALDALKA